MIRSGYQIIMKQKASRRPILEDLCHSVFPAKAPKPKTMTEISGGMGAGKTLILNRIIAKAVLPKALGGKACKVIFVDANHKCGIARFKMCLIGAVLESALGDTGLDHDAVLKLCLDSVILLPCYTTEQFDLAWETVEDLLWHHEDVALIAIDGINTFYWEDCYRRLVRMKTHYNKLCKRIKSICEDNGICCVYTVDTNYLCTKGVANPTNPLVDYKIQLLMNTKGERSINDKRFSIVCSNDALSVKIE